MLPQNDVSCLDATHKKSLDLISQRRKIVFVALHNLIGLKHGCSVSRRVERQYPINDYFPGELNVFNP
jgi:hypothetical protein